MLKNCRATNKLVLKNRLSVFKFMRASLFVCCLLSAYISGQVSYKFDLKTMTHNVYLHCKRNVKRVPIKIIDGNIIIKSNIRCKKNEQKGISIIYPSFTNNLQFIYRIGTKITKKILRTSSNSNYIKRDINLKEKTFYKIRFLYNYLIITLIVVFLFVAFKVLYVINKKLSIIFFTFAVVITTYLFSSIDIYYLDRDDETDGNFIIAYKFFGAQKSIYNLANNNIYLYPINGKAIIDFDNNIIYVYSPKNLYLIYKNNRNKLLLLWKA